MKKNILLLVLTLSLILIPSAPINAMLASGLIKSVIRAATINTRSLLHQVQSRTNLLRPIQRINTYTKPTNFTAYLAALQTPKFFIRQTVSAPQPFIASRTVNAQTKKMIPQNNFFQLRQFFSTKNAAYPEHEKSLLPASKLTALDQKSSAKKLIDDFKTSFEQLNVPGRGIYIGKWQASADQEEQILKKLCDYPHVFKELLQDSDLDSIEYGITSFLDSILKNQRCLEYFRKLALDRDIFFILIDKNSYTIVNFFEILSPQELAPFVELICDVNSIATIAQKNTDIIYQIIKKIPQTTEILLPYLLKKEIFSKVMNDYFSGQKLIEHLWNTHPTINDHLLSLALERENFIIFAQVHNTYRDKGLLERFLQEFPNAHTSFTHLIQEIISGKDPEKNCIKLESIHNAIKLILNNCPDSLQEWLSYISNKRNFTCFANGGLSGIEVLIKLGEKSNKALEIFYPYLCEKNIYSSITNYSQGIKLIKKIIEVFPDYIYTLANFIKEDPAIIENSLTYTDMGRNIFKQVIEKNPLLEPVCLEYCLKKIEEDTYEINDLFKVFCTEIVLTAIRSLARRNQAIEHSSLQILKILNLNHENELDYSLKTQLPTLGHIYTNIKQILQSEVVKSYCRSDMLHECYKKMMATELTFNKSGHYTFYHAQRRDYYFPEQLYTLLFQIKNQTRTPDFLFLHLKKPITDSVELSKEAELTKELRNNGRTDDASRQQLLFLNYALFANENNSGSNSALYALNNHNMGGINLDCKKIFSFFGYDHIYAQYKKEIMKLNEEYKQLSHTGNLMLIAVPQDIVDKIVFTSYSGGITRKPYINQIGKANDTKKVLETLCKDPEQIPDTDIIEFCLIMTQKDGGLDPTTGIKVIPFVTGDQTKVEELHSKERDLFNRITKTILAEEID